MEAHFKRIVFPDEAFEFAPPGHGFTGWCVSAWHGFFPPPVLRVREFQNYALAYRWTASDRELELIKAHQMFGHVALKLHDDFPPLTFADLLGPEFIADVNPSQTELLRIEARVREAALTWTLFFENLDSDE
jgi:hypothetical protein